MDETQSFGKWLRHRRRDLDLTQEGFSRQVGCAPITLRRIEADDLRPSKQLAELLIERLGIQGEERERFVQFARGGALAKPVTATSPKHNLPYLVSSFIGREREILVVKRLMDASRLVTLTGAGGSGKTRLALQIAGQVLDQFPEGVWFVGFAPLSEPSLVQQTIASVLRVQEDPSRPLIQTLIDYLNPKKLLMLFDNCEHLISECSQIAERLLQTCPQLHLLVTSREALGFAGEAQYYVPTLSLPETMGTASLKNLKHSEAVRLFVERAQTINHDFELTKPNAAAVVHICQQLDGIPLALELAASRVKLLTIEHIAERLVDRFDLLTSGNRTALPRQQTLRATIDWSYNLLAESTKLLFNRLAVFAGGFTQMSVREVCYDEQLEPNTVLAELSRLVDRSLVEIVQKGEEERYQMLETIRLYARERLRESGEEGCIQDRHLKFFMVWAEEVEPKLRGPKQITWWDRMEMEHNNIRSALEWSLSGGDVQSGLRLAGAAFWFWKQRSYWREGLKWLKDTLAKTPTQQRTSVRAKALVVAGFMAQEMYTSDPVEAWYQEGLGILREVGDKWWISYALLVMGWQRILMNEAASAKALFEESVAFARGAQDAWILGYALRGLGAVTERFDYAASRPILEESLIHTRITGDHYALGDALKQLGTVAWGQGDYTRLESLGKESLKLFREIGYKEMETESLLLLAEAILGQGDAQHARKLFEESLTIAESVGYISLVGEVLALLGCVAELEGQPRRSATLLAAGESTLNSIGTTIATWPWAFSSYQQCMAKVKKQLGETELSQALAEGQAITMKQAVKYALEKTK